MNLHTPATYSLELLFVNMSMAETLLVSLSTAAGYITVSNNLVFTIYGLLCNNLCVSP